MRDRSARFRCAEAGLGDLLGRDGKVGVMLGSV
jgi:hypothetical protein